MENLLQIPSETTISQPYERGENDAASRRLSTEAFSEMDRITTTTRISDAAQKILPDCSFECSGSNTKYDPIENDRKSLLKLADKHIKDPRLLAQFELDMALFETRAQKDGLSPGEIKETYNNVARLLKAGPDARVKDTDRAAIAHQIMRQAADPRTIDQGNHNTCNVTAIEVNLYTKEPSRVAGLIADVVTTGRYQGAIGKPVSVPTSTFRPDLEARNAHTKDGERSFASQIFQMTAVNLYNRNERRLMRYEQVEGGHGDTVERLRPLGLFPIGLTSPAFTIDEVAATHELIVGRKDPMLFLHHKDYSATGRESVSVFSSKDDLTKMLDEAQRLKRFPLIMTINVGHPPYNQSGGWHVVNIRDYDATAGRVMFDNSWGRYDDRTMSIDELYVLSTKPGAKRN